MRKPVFTDFLPGATPTTKEPIRSGPVQVPVKPTVADKIAPKLTREERAKAEKERAAAKSKKSFKPVRIGKDSYDYEFTGWDTMTVAQKQKALAEARADILANDPTANKKAPNAYAETKPFTDGDAVKAVANQFLGATPGVQAANAVANTPMGAVGSEKLRNFAKAINVQVPKSTLYDQEGVQMLADLTVNAPSQTAGAAADFLDPKTDNIGRVASGLQVGATVLGGAQAAKAGKVAFDAARRSGAGVAKAVGQGVGSAVMDSIGFNTPDAPVRMDALESPKVQSFAKAIGVGADDVSGVVPSFRQPISKMPENRIESLSPQGRALESWAGANLQKLLDNGAGEDLRTWDAVGKHYGSGAVPRNPEEFKYWVNDLVRTVDENDRNLSLSTEFATKDYAREMQDLRKLVSRSTPIPVNADPAKTIVGLRRQGRGWIPVSNPQLVPLSSVPEPFRLSVLDSVRDTELRYTTQSNFQAWKDQGKPDSGVLRTRTASELATNEMGGDQSLSDFVTNIGRDGGSDILVPRDAVRAFVRNHFNQQTRAGQAAAAMRKPVKPEDFEAAVKHYNGEAVPAPVSAATPKPVEMKAPVAAKPTVTAPKVEVKAAQASAVESGGDLVGYAKQVSGNDPLPGVNREQLLKAGEDAIASGKVNPDSFVDGVINRGSKGDQESIAASLIEYRKIRNRQQELEKLGTPDAVDEWGKLQERADKYSQAGDLIGNDWHKTGMALQIALKQDMSLGALKSRAKMMNFGQDVSEATSKKLEDLNKQYEAALKEIDKLKTNNADVMDRIKTNRIEPRHAVRSREKARAVAADYFSGRTVNPTDGVGKNRQRGAVTYTITPEEIRAKSAVRKLAKEIALDGADNLKAVLDGIRKEIGVPVKDEQLLGMIYEPYTKYRIEADVARIKSNQALSDVQRAAEFRAMPARRKAARVVLGVANGIQRSFQAGADFSAPMIQGRKGLFANPVGWVKAYKPMFASAIGKRADDIALKELAKIEAHPMYARARAAGLELTIPGGKFSAQEETFAGNISQIIDAIDSAKGIGKAGVIAKPWLSVLERSEDAFTTYMNSLRYDTFVKMAKAMPNDVEYLKDVADIINVIYGRGTGKFARAVGEIGGELIFAPRYTVSNIQYQLGVPFWKSNTAAGRRQAAKIYATHVAAVGSLIYLAKLSGWQVGTDPRATDFGKISNGQITIDLAAKDTQFIRLMTQIMYGKVNKAGKFTKPSGRETATRVGEFIQNKSAPGVRLASEYWLGVYDDSTGGTRDMEGKDLAMKAAPLWVQELIRDSEKWKGEEGKRAAATLVSIFGLEVKPGEISQESNPLDWTKPVVKKKS